jgi:hypothetical protein
VGDEPVADERSHQVRDLASREDWRARVDALALSEDAAHDLRVAVLRERVFNAAERGADRARRRGRSVR